MSERIGYFNTPTEEKPAYDPGLDIDCVVCEAPLVKPLQTHSFMGENGSRSYFVRTHVGCDPSEFIGNAIDEVIGL